MTHPSTDQLRAIFKLHASNKDAPAMEAYMKHHFKFMGLKKPIRSANEKEWIHACKKMDFEGLQKCIIELWEQPEREFQYTALELAVKSRIEKNENSIDLLRKLITEKSWWDSVDLIASKLVGGYFLHHPANRDKIIGAWNMENNLWLIRTTILFQLSYREKTDFDFMRQMILPHIDSKEFFIQKAIGWSLRQYARTNPQAVLQFVNAVDLKPLSRREALKHFEHD